MTAASGTEARDNGRGYTRYDSGMCQKFVRGPCWEVGSLYGSAIEAWNGAAEKHPGDRTPPIGAPCYYSGGQYGHAVIYAGDGKIRSTDCTTTGQVSEQPLDWPERAWGYTYLGWTGDINGVDLPLQEGDTMALSTQDLDKIRSIVAQELNDDHEAIANVVWNRLVTSSWDGSQVKARDLLSQTNYYALQAGIISTVPAGGSRPGSRTTAGILADKIDDLPDE